MKINKAKQTGIAFIIIGIVALLSAGGLYLRNTMEENHAAEASDHAAQLLLEKIAQNAENAAHGIPVIPGAKDEPVTNIPDAQVPDTSGAVYPIDELKSPTAKVDNELYIGVLSIPAIRLQWPINSVWSYPKLKNTPCRYSGSAEENTLVIAAHNYRYHFGRFTNLKVGDRVLFTDVNGKEYKYSVAEIETIAPTNVKKVINSKFDLNLFTCNYSGDARIAVKCRLIDE